MVQINIQNIEEIIFYNQQVWNLIPDMKNYYQQWSMSQRVAGLKELGKRTIIEFMQALTESHLKKLEEYFQETILVQKIDTRILVSLSFDKNDLEQNLCKYDNYKDFFISRNKDQVNICFWR